MSKGWQGICVCYSKMFKDFSLKKFFIVINKMYIKFTYISTCRNLVYVMIWCLGYCYPTLKASVKIYHFDALGNKNNLSAHVKMLAW